MATQQRDLSPVLLAAQRRLKLLQKQFQEERATHGQFANADDDNRLPGPDSLLLPKAHPLLISTVDFPDHLGWESTTLTAALRAGHQRRKRNRETAGGRQQPVDKGQQPTSNRKNASNFLNSYSQQPVRQARSRQWSPSTHEACPSPSVKLYPDLALAMLRQGQVAAGRIWLLLKYLDKDGRGWIRIDEARKQLTNKKSGLYVCGWRQLRNLLAQGENIFWLRQSERIWLHATVKVAASLGIWHLKYRPVALPLAHLRQSIGTIRAHFYASLHSSRSKASNADRKQSQPIARITIAEITAINPRTQRIYEKKANVHKQYNFALGEQATVEQEEERAWRQGQALFRLTDHKGKQGKPGTTYLAWQLPNNYFGPHDQQPRGQQKRLNQKLSDLFRKGRTGNGQKMAKECGERRPKRFYGNGRLAAKAYNSGNRNIYWPSCQQPGQQGYYRLWYALSPVNR